MGCYLKKGTLTQTTINWTTCINKKYFFRIQKTIIQTFSIYLNINPQKAEARIMLNLYVPIIKILYWFKDFFT